MTKTLKDSKKQNTLIKSSLLATKKTGKVGAKSGKNKGKKPAARGSKAKGKKGARRRLGPLRPNPRLTLATLRERGLLQGEKKE